MLFSKQLPLRVLIELCRALRHNLGAGITLRAVFRQQAERGPAELRPLAQRVADRLEQGESLVDALELDREHFPHLFLSLTRLGEETGNLPEIYAELEKYYLLQQKLGRQFRSQAFLPAVQFVAALLIIASLILVLGLIAVARNTQPITLFGLSGPAGALTFLVITFGGIALMYLAYRVLPGMLKQKAAADAFLLRIPAVGSCLYALVMNRFTMALQLTLETGMPISRALTISLHSTGNAAFAGKADDVAQALKNGEPLVEALSRSRLFGTEFLNIVAVGEESGRIPEVMRHQMDYWAEEASRKMTVLAQLATKGIWVLYAIFMVVMIFRIASIYLNALGGAMGK